MDEVLLADGCTTFQNIASDKDKKRLLLPIRKEIPDCKNAEYCNTSADKNLCSFWVFLTHNRTGGRELDTISIQSRFPAGV
ncbi:MAG TPA: hypothetical protein PLW50_00640 [Smithellaceae bacterium]|nr:hypothetical protein [Smithellaceae bacterium]